jgi:hypothetical protein
MPKPFPCPNPRCKHVFTPEQVTAAAVTCPACGISFRLRKAAKTPPPPPPAPPPLPVAAPVQRQTEGPLPPVIVAPTRRLHRRRGGFLTGLLVFAALCGTAGALLYHYRDELSSVLDPAAEEQKGFRKQANFSFRATGGWRPDEALRDRLRAALGLSLKKPRGHMALFYRDYQTRAVPDAELLDQALLRLRAAFPQLEYEDPFSGENKGRSSDLSGEPAIVFTFSGAGADEVPVRGRCCMLFRRGYAYWLMFWGPEDYHDQLVPHWEQLQEGFTLHDDRDGWKPMPRPAETFTGRKLAYQLDFAKEVWKKLDDAGEADAAAELLLRGFEPSPDDETGKPRVVELAGKAAEVRVLVLPKAADLAAAVAAVREHLHKKLGETNPGVKIEAITDPKTGNPLSASAVGAFPGQSDALRLVLAPENERYARVAVVKQPDGVLALVCECRWERRGYWEEEFTALLKTVRPAPEAADDP